MEDERVALGEEDTWRRGTIRLTKGRAKAILDAKAECNGDVIGGDYSVVVVDHGGEDIPLMGDESDVLIKEADDGWIGRPKRIVRPRRANHLMPKQAGNRIMDEKVVDLEVRYVVELMIGPLGGVLRVDSGETTPLNGCTLVRRGHGAIGDGKGRGDGRKNVTGKFCHKELGSLVSMPEKVEGHQRRQGNTGEVP
ncbi:hypothetical protein U1Q18_032734 [Sarracenia purpurea var. burkii]